MKDVTVRKDDLLARLRGNRDRHGQIFEKAVDRYRDRCLELLEESIEQVRTMKDPEQIYIQLPVPENHTDDYDAVIDMLEMEVGDEITMTERDFRTYVRDEWDWKGRWAQTTSSYVA